MKILLLNARRRVFFVNQLKKLAPEFLHFETIFADCDPNDPMRKVCDHFELLPPMKSAEYWDALVSLIERRSIRWIMPWLDGEIRLLSERREEIEAKGCRLFLPPAEFVDTVTDKVRTWEWARGHGLRQPERYANLVEAKFPLVMKPRFGQGGVGVKLIESAAQAIVSDQTLLQEYIAGTEYTCDIWLQKGGVPLFIVPRKRLKVRGEVMIAQVEHSPTVMDYLTALCRCLDFDGMFNVQVMVRDGECFLIEINPRFGGGSDLTHAAGGDFPRYILESMLQGGVVSAAPRIRDGLMMTRYYESFFFHPDEPDLWF